MNQWWTRRAAKLFGRELQQIDFLSYMFGKWERRQLIRGSFSYLKNHYRLLFRPRIIHFCQNILILSCDPVPLTYYKWLVAMWFPSHLCDEGNSSFTSKLLKIQELWQNFLKILIPLSSFLPTILSASVVVSIFQPRNKGDSSNRRGIIL
jgi:hypothetical protein